MAESVRSGRLPQGGRPVLRYGELIASDLDVIHSTASTLFGHQAFAGNQPDDFALAARTAHEPRILLLGLGLGGSIRSMLAANPRARITAVDVSAESLRLSRALHELYFPAVEYHEVIADAREVRAAVDGEFDAVCIDVYDEIGYPDFMTDVAFWESVGAMRATKSSVIMANVWGLPTHLDWAANAPIQRAVAGVMGESLGSIYALPHRRNITLTTRLPVWGSMPDSAPNVDSLRARIDSIQLRLLALRMQRATPVAVSSEQISITADGRSKRRLNEIMQELWPSALRELLDMGAENGQRPRSLLHLVSDAGAVSEVSVRAAGDMGFFLPNVASNWLHQYGTMPEWYRVATESNAELMFAEDPGQFVLGWFTQYVALLLKCPTGLEVATDLGAWVGLAEEIIQFIEQKEKL